MNEEPGRIQPRRNIIDKPGLSFRKRYEVVGYWIMLAVVLMLAIWFLTASASNRGASEDAHATVIATLFVPETATAEAEATAGTTSE
jgi:hypothetical protein